jgi:hypothetical protein
MLCHQRQQHLLETRNLRRIEGKTEQEKKKRRLIKRIVPAPYPFCRSIKISDKSTARGLEQKQQGGKKKKKSKILDG